MYIIATLIGLILFVAILIFLACWIINIIVALQQDDVLLGVLSICGLLGFVIGWIKVGEWRHHKIMIAWTASIIACVGLHLLSTFILMAKAF